MPKDHLIVIDMQEKFMEDKDPQRVASALVAINYLVTHFRNLALPITFAMFPGEKYGSLLSQLNSHQEEIVVKNESDAFSSDQFQKRVNESDVLHLTGCNLDVCVRLTAESAVNYGKSVIVYKNAVLQRDGFRNKNNATWMEFFLNPAIHIKNSS